MVGLQTLWLSTGCISEHIQPSPHDTEEDLEILSSVEEAKCEEADDQVDEGDDWQVADTFSAPELQDPGSSLMLSDPAMV